MHVKKLFRSPCELSQYGDRLTGRLRKERVVKYKDDIVCIMQNTVYNYNDICLEKFKTLTM